MIPSAFEYRRASSVEEAVALLSQEGDEAKLLAGGHSLIPLMKLRLASPTILVDVGAFAELVYVREEGERLAIGGLTTHADVNNDALLKEHCPILAYAAGKVGDRQVRNKGTIAGSVVHGDPASDLPAVLLALDADFVVQGPRGKRVSPAQGFFKGLFEVNLAQDEMLVEVRVPRALGGWSYDKFRGRAQDWAIVGVAVVRDSHRSGSTAVGLATMGDTPLRASGVEEALAAGASPEEAARQVSIGTSPPSDQKASAEYRTRIAEVLTRRALARTGS